MTYNSMPMHQGRELPTFRLREIDLPNVTTWDIGKEYYIVMKVKMIGKEMQQSSEARQDAHKVEGTFEMTSIKPLGDKPIDERQLVQEDYEKMKATALSGD